MNILARLMPSRRAAEPIRQDTVRDLDALIEQPVYFRLMGKTRKINPITTQSFFEFTARYHELLELRKKEGLTSDHLADKYHQLAKSVCEDISLDEIKSMTPAQTAALLQMIIDTVTGEIHSDEKKKMMEPLDTQERSAQ